MTIAEYKVPIAIIAGLLLLGGAFWGGMAYERQAGRQGPEFMVPPLLPGTPESVSGPIESLEANYIGVAGREFRLAEGVEIYRQTEKDPVQLQAEMVAFNVASANFTLDNPDSMPPLPPDPFVREPLELGDLAVGKRVVVVTRGGESAGKNDAVSIVVLPEPVPMPGQSPAPAMP